MPIGKGGSFTPLTWKNVDTGNPAAFFNSAIEGADRLVDQSLRINEVEDSRLLNEALNRQRLGQPAQFDRRVDQITLQESDAFSEKLKSDLLGAGLNQDIDRITISEAPKRLRLLQEQANSAAANANSEQERVKILQAMAKEEQRIRDEAAATQAGANKYADAKQDLKSKLYEQHLNQLQIDNPTWQDSDTLKQSILIDAQKFTERDLNQAIQGGIIRKNTGVSNKQFRATNTYAQLTAAGDVNKLVDEKVREHLNKTRDSKEEWFNQAYSGDMRAVGIDKNGTTIPIDPKSQTMTGPKLTNMLQRLTHETSKVDFIGGKLSPENTKSMTAIASVISSSLADNITRNIITAKTEARGRSKMTSDEFARAFLDAAYKKQSGIQGEMETFAGLNKPELSAVDALKIATGNTVVSADTADPIKSIEYKLDTPKTGQAGAIAIGKIFENVDKEIEAFPQSIKQQYVGAIDRIELLQKQVNFKHISLEQKQDFIDEINTLIKIIRVDVGKAKAQEAADILSNALNEAL